MFNYPVTLTPDDNGTYLVGFPDFPEANSIGGDQSEALLNAVDALESVLDMYFDQRRAIPAPSKGEPGQHLLALPALETAKVLLWNEMLEKKLRKADLARMLNVHMPQIDRLFDLGHSSKIEFVEQAAKALGKSLTISLV